MDYQILIKSLILYVLLFIVMRFMGKREIGELSLFDFVVLLILADIGVSGINQNDNFINYIIPILILTLIQKLIGLILLKLPKLRSFFDDKESVIINNGKICYKEMQKIKYNFDDLLTQLRLKNVRSISEVSYAILETNGELSVFLNHEKEEVYLKDSTLVKTTKEAVKLNPFPLIVSGVIKENNLKLLNLDRKWLITILKKKGVDTYKDILYAHFDGNDLFIITNGDVSKND